MYWIHYSSLIWLRDFKLNHLDVLILPMTQRIPTKKSTFLVAPNESLNFQDINNSHPEKDLHH